MHQFLVLQAARLASMLLLAVTVALPCGVLVAAEDGEEEPHELELVKVTGYRIKRAEYEGPAPVDVFPRSEIEEAGANTLGEFFRYLPQALGPVSETAQTSGFGGAAFIDLRGIGIDNTLTLLNGKRVAAYGVNGSAEPFVDINAIPLAAIERVEILKDGASAIYGADAVAGVVNIILRDSFDGLQVGGGYLSTTEGDGDEWTADLVWGWNDADTSVLATFAYFDKSPILARDRSWSDDVDYRDQGGPNLRAFNGTPSTYFDIANFQNIPDPECGVDPRISSIQSIPFFGDFCAFNYAWFQQLTYDTQIMGGNLNVRQEFSDALRGRLELFYSRRENLARVAPTPVLGGLIPPNHPNNPYGAPLNLAGRPLDTGDRLFDTTANTYRLVTGLAGLWGNWDWSADLLLSGNDVATDRRNAVFADRYYAALQGMGGPGGDLWYNPFGANPQNEPALIDWMTTNTRFGADTTENAIELEVTTFFGALPGGAVGVAGGLTYREQKLDEFADEVERSGQLAGGNQITQIQADRDILAAYAEFSLPLLPTLEAQVALRYDDYSDFGSTTNPKIALAWRPGRDWLFRASYSTSFRPPSFTELFNPPVLNAGFFTDVERCEGTGAPQDCTPFQYPVLNVGNPELQPEEGASYFAGFVWSPEFLEGLDLELDYWRFKHTERIIELNPQLILDAKGNQGVTRAPPTEGDIALGVPGRIEQVTQTFVNSDELETSGLDFIARYRRDTGSAGMFGLALSYTYVDEYVLNEAALGSAETGVNYAGRYFNFDFGIPKHRGNLNLTWQSGPHGVAANIRYAGDYEGAFNRFEDGEDTGMPWTVDSQTTLDLQYSHLFGNQSTELRLGCRNCTDEAPPTTFNFLGEGLYDYRGAMLYLRVQHHFQ